jgi:hypothetical protein
MIKPSMNVTNVNRRKGFLLRLGRLGVLVPSEEFVVLGRFLPCALLNCSAFLKSGYHA